MGKTPAKQRIAETVNRMMLTDSLENMTIASICKECGVSRQCFYNNFKDKYDVIDWIYRTEAVDFFSLIGTEYSWYEAVIAKLHMVQNNRKFYRQAYRQEWFLNSFFNITKTLYKDSIAKKIGAKETEKLDAELDFYCTACVRVTGNWVMNDFAESPQRLVETFLDCIPKSLRQYLVTEEEEKMIHREADRSERRTNR
ncbi:MAG: TetR/AcrR family transcriptional regulator C-terminal domain-containing protein [Eubacteriaceae bacterium]|jgi:AcrR family transcriptional regulator|nr:TetR/AcrR family transcriptional regulator C-terminal domain-containing protein [Eubacteriaceae bacterium]